MISGKTHLTIKKGERLYQFICEHDSPLGEIHDVLHEMKQHIVSSIIERAAQEREHLEPKSPETIPEVTAEVISG